MPKDNIPEIRGRGFSDEWKQRKVSELFRVTRGYVLAAIQTETMKTDEKPYPVYSSQTKDKGLMGYYKDYLYEDAITWTTDGANAGTVNYRAGKFYCTNVCGVLLSNEVKANQMIAEALNNVAKGYVSYVGNPKLMNNVMADIVIQIPTQAEEREQLSSFFTNLDKLITLHQHKYEALVSVKKTMLEKMFPKEGETVPEIRFAGFTDFWEQRKLGDITDFVTGKSFSQDLSADGTYVVMDMGTVSQEGNRIETKLTLVNRDVLSENDLVMPKDDIGGGLIIGRTVHIPANNQYVLGDHVYRLRFKNENGLFLHYQINSDSVRKQIMPLVTGSAQLGLNSKNIQGVYVNIPSVDEQVKIGEYFSNLDNLITLHQRKCVVLKNLKSALLNKMFVNTTE